MYPAQLRVVSTKRRRFLLLKEAEDRFQRTTFSSSTQFRCMGTEAPIAAKSGAMKIASMKRTQPFENNEPSTLHYET